MKASLTREAKVERTGTTVKLIEPAVEDSIVFIQGVPNDAIIIQSDEFPTSFFEDDNGECKRADYIILAKQNGEKYAIYIEMQRGKKNENHIIKELKGGLCLIEYCSSKFPRTEEFPFGISSSFHLLHSYKNRHTTDTHWAKDQKT